MFACVFDSGVLAWGCNQDVSPAEAPAQKCSNTTMQANICDDSTVFDIQKSLFDRQWRQGTNNGHGIWKEMSYQSCLLYTLSKLIGLKIPIDTAFMNETPSQDGYSLLAEGISAYAYTSSVVGGFAINVVLAVFSTCTMSMISAIAAHFISSHAQRFRPLTFRAQISLNIKLMFYVTIVLISTSCLFAVGFWKVVDVSSEISIFQYN